MSEEPYKLALEIIPSPGTQIQDFAAMKQKLDLVIPFAKSIHLDFLDGKFVNNSNFMNPMSFKEYADKVLLEAHFMTDNPIQYIRKFADAGFKRFIGQVEKMPDISAFVAEGQLYGEVGLAIDGPTPLERIDIPFDDLDVVLFYTGEKAGFSGAVLLPDRLEKVKALRGKDSFIPIEVDGGITDKTILLAKEAGVTRFVSTGFIYSGTDPKSQIEILQQVIQEA